MQKLVLTAALLGAASISLPDAAVAHGGTYRGPVDFVPPGAGGGGGGVGAPGTPTPGSPAPSQPGVPGSSSPTAAAGPQRPGNPNTSGALNSGPDLTVWQYWWGFNKQPYLNLKAAIHSGAVQTGSDEFYLGYGEEEQQRDSVAPSPAVIRGTIVPALKRALETERSNDILDGSLIALAKIGDELEESGAEPLSDAIKPFLSDSSQQLSETAAVALGILASASEDNVNILLHMLRDEGAALRNKYDVQIGTTVPTRSRAFAAFGLGLVGFYSPEQEVRTRINAAMVELLDGEGKSMGTRDVPVACLTAMGLTPLASDPSCEPLDLSGGWLRPAQVTNLTEQIQYLMSFYEDTQRNNFVVLAHVPMAVARLLQHAPRESVLREAVARRFLQDVRKRAKVAREVQQSCVQALGVIGDCDEDPVDAEIRTSLMAVASGELADQQARNFALIALGQVAGRPGRGVGDAVGGLKVARRDNPRSFLITQLATAKTGMRPWAALGLAVMERSLADANVETSADARAALRAALADARSPAEVGAYAVAVGIARDEGAQQLLAQKLERLSDDEARGFCAVGLGLVSDFGAIDQITEVIEKSKYKPSLLKSAAIGLGLLGDKQIVTQLIGMLEGATSLSSQAAISSALGFIGDRRSVDPLIAMLQDQSKTDLARGFAAVALGIVADKEPLPWNTKIAVNINYRANTTTLTSPEQGTGILDLL